MATAAASSRGWTFVKTVTQDVSALRDMTQTIGHVLHAPSTPPVCREETKLLPWRHSADEGEEAHCC
ncbi:hypothetical protein N7478_010176 [Penicillium angulare]|uniref:uncharacterized protein n=1 Tax=Penicillium angulare TaxID=116970 RepID=UPI00254113AE|nr:uncharacterized protein N7478_010176 [Penicillium angulare]KAJ5267368.1 hypothetical protein N7478_010176 [Penicillium angulare]